MVFVDYPDSRKAEVEFTQRVVDEGDRYQQLRGMTPVSSPQNEAQLARRAGVQAWYNVLRVGEISASEL